MFGSSIFSDSPGMLVPLRTQRVRIAVAMLLTAIWLSSDQLVVAAENFANVARYEGLATDAFLTRWLVLGPIPVTAANDPTEADPKNSETKRAGDAAGKGVTSRQDAEPDQRLQRKAFAADFLKAHGGEAGVRPTEQDPYKIARRDFRWKPVRAAGSNVNLAEAVGGEFVVAYAWAEIVMPEKKLALLGLGSDDAVKVWLNGKLVHDHWVARGLQTDDDVIPIELNAGPNRLLLKVQNGRLSWGFSCRLLGKASIAQRLGRAVIAGDVDALKAALVRGVDINSPTNAGLTPLHVAKIHGQTEVATFLVSRGAEAKIAMPAPEKVIDAMLAERTAGISSGIAVLVAHRGKIVYEKGFGFANLEHRVPVTTQTKFRIGSITKQFTAAAILKLQEQGKLKVDDALSKYISDFPKGDKVTIHHLLTHTSGIHSYTSKADFLNTVRLVVTPQDLIGSFKNDPYDFEPGANWAYNNSGYFLLGFIIEKASGQNYGEFLKKAFFDPLQMTSSGIHQSTDIIEHEAHGYAFDQGTLRKAENWDMSRAGAAGALYSTVGDLFRWNEAVFAGKVLSDSSLKSAFTAVRTASEDAKAPKADGYGYGWGLGSTRGLREISHGGGLHGFNSFLLRLPQEDFTVVALANALPAPPGLDAAGVAHDIATYFLWQKMAARPVHIARRDITPAVLDAYVGRYDYGPAVLEVTRDGNRIFAQLTGQARFEIFPKSETEFFWKVVDANVTFVKDEKGRVTKAVHRQSGQTINASKLPEIPIAKIDAKIYDTYVGKYSLQGIALTVTREGDRLFVQLTGQPKFEIFPMSETEFFLKAVNAQLAFVKSNDGKVVKAILEQAGRKMDAPRKE